MMMPPRNASCSRPRPRVDQSVADDRQERRAEEGADDGAVAPEERGAANDDGGDHRQLVPGPGGRRDRGQVGEAERAGERGGERAEDEADHLDAANRNPGRRAAVSLLPVACTQ